MPDIRPELSSKNPYWIDRHRYYELKHFCLQYPLWKKLRREIDGINGKIFSDMPKQMTSGNPTLWAVERREEYDLKIRMVERCAHEASPELWHYILKAVTEELSYENLRRFHQMPAGKELYYSVYRKFFYILDEARK